MKNALHLKYLIASEQDELWGLRINSVGYQMIAPGESYPPTYHPTRYLFSSEKGRILSEYQLLYISKGKGTFVSKNHKKTEIKAGDMFLLFPHEWHNYAPHKSTGWNEYWIGFEGSTIDNIVKHAFFSKSKPIFNIGLNEEVVNLYSRTIGVAERQLAGFQQMLAGAVNYLLGIAYSQHKLSSLQGLNVTDQIEKAKIIIHESYKDNISLEHIAEQVNMSYSWFRRVFKEYCGLTPLQYIQEVRMQKSKEYLSNTLLSSQEIAYIVGFESADYFCTVFKKKNKVTPIQYRKAMRGGNIDSDQ